MPEDPFKKYGGQEIKDQQEDPFKKYGGQSIEEPVKKKVGLGEAIGGFAKYLEDTPYKSAYQLQSESDNAKLAGVKIYTPTKEELPKEHQVEIDHKDPVGSVISPMLQRKREIFNQNIGIESTGQNQLNKQAASQEVNGINDAVNSIKKAVFPTADQAQLWRDRNPHTSEDNVTAKLADDVILDNKKVQMALQDNGGDISKAALQYYRAFDNPLAEQLSVLKNGNQTPTGELWGQLTHSFLQNPNVQNWAHKSQENLNALKAQETGLYQQFPDLHNQKLLSDYAAARESMNRNNWFYNDQASNMDGIVNKLVETGKWNRFDKDRFVKQLALGVATGKIDVPTPGLLENIKKVGVNSIADLPKTLAEISGVRHLYKSDADLLNESLKETYSKPNTPNYGLGHQISNATGNLAGVLLPLSGEAKALEATGLIKDAKLANELATGLTFYHDIQSKAIQDNPGDPKMAHLSALIQSLVWMKGAQALPKLSQDAVKGIAPEINDVLNGLKTNTIDNATAARKIASMAMNTFGESLSTSSKVAGTVALNDAIGGALSGKFDLDKTAQDVAGTFKSLMLGTPLMSFGKARNEANLHREIINDAAENPEFYKHHIDKLAETDPKLAQELNQNLDAAVKIKSALGLRTDLTDGQKKRFLLPALREYSLNNKAAEIPNDKLKEPILKNIETAKKEQENIINEPKPTIESAIITVGGKTYEGKNHAEAILKAKEDGQDISNVDRQGEGKFKLSDGSIIDREEAQKMFGNDKAELLIKQDDAAKKADNEYEKIKQGITEVQPDEISKPIELDQNLPEGYVAPEISKPESEVNLPQNTTQEQQESAAAPEPDSGKTSTEGEQLPPEPPASEPPTTVPTLPEAEGSENTKVANAVNDALVKDKFGVDALDEIISKLQDTDLAKTYTAIKERAVKGKLDPNVTREKVLTQKSGNAEDQAVLLYDMAQLKGNEKELRRSIIETTDPKVKEELQKQLVEVQNKMMDNALANRYIGRDWHNIGFIRQQWIDKDYNIVDMQNEYMASKGLSELTDAQKEEVQKYHDTIKNLGAKIDIAKAERDKALNENETLRMENLKLQELKDKATSQKRADRGKKADESVKKSQERVQKAKDELKKLRGNLNSGFDPRAAAQITKIAAEYTYQGVVKLNELVERVLDTIKDVFPDWTEKDVRLHLFGEKMETEKYFEAGKKYEHTTQELRDKIKNYNDLQKEYALKKFEWQKERREDLMKNRPFKDKVIDGMLRWQRFAILSYPTTFFKLIGVVAHQLTLKPLKFAIQKFIAHPISKALGIADKQSIWGNPTAKSLGKYYSEFVRNFSLQNLKEQFKGIDTKEILYGNRFMYDEWAASKGFLELPGRSHGYIKSFIKNPEFKYAQENIATQHINKMSEIESKLKDDKLSDEEKTKLKEEYAKWDITNPDIMERVNKLSLEHGKWAILMNDNNFTKKFQEWAKNNGFAGALAKSELPIIKIPINYIYRAFATKYGLIRAFTGKGRWESKDKNFPGIIEMLAKGTKNVTPEQAEILSRCITLGSMGATFFTMGYLLRSQIKQNDDGSYDMFGKHVNKNFVHSPEFESIFSGAETGHEFDKDKKKDAANWIKSFVESDIDIAKKSPFVNMLKYGFTANVATALLSKDDGDKVWGKITDATAKKISDMTIPGFIKQSAGAMDVPGKNFDIFSHPTSRKPVGTDLERFWQAFELGIPGLRENVPATGFHSFTDEDKQDPSLKYFIDKGLELPNVSHSSTTIKDGKKLSEYDKDVQDKYDDLHKSELKKELGSIVKRDYVFIERYPNGKFSVSEHRTPHSKREELNKLSDEELASILGIAQRKATENTKKKLFK